MKRTGPFIQRRVVKIGRIHPFFNIPNKKNKTKKKEEKSKTKGKNLGPGPGDGKRDCVELEGLIIFYFGLFVESSAT